MSRKNRIKKNRTSSPVIHRYVAEVEDSKDARSRLKRKAILLAVLLSPLGGLLLLLLF